MQENEQADVGSFKRSILPLFLNSISRARRASCSSLLSSEENCQDSPGVSMRRICLPDTSRVTSWGRLVVVGVSEEDERE